MDPNLSFRMVTSADMLKNVAPGVFDGHLDPALTDEFITDPRHHLAIACVGDEVVGMASAVHYVHPDKPSQMWINEVGVAPPHQRRGIGKHLLRLLLDHARQIGCGEAWVGTETENTAARRLYTAVGGREESMVYFTFDVGEQA